MSHAINMGIGNGMGMEIKQCDTVGTIQLPQSDYPYGKY